MINKTERIVEQKIVDVRSVSCDRCKKEYPHTDIMEIQEFHYVRITGGYGSIFGDDNDIECDICQHCLLELIKDFYRNVSTQN